MNDNEPSQRMDEREFLRRVLIVLGIVVLALLLWTVVRVFLLAFAGVLVAIILRTTADLLERWAKVPERWSLLASGLLLVVAGCGLVFLLGAQAVEQFGQLSQTLPAMLSSLSERFNALGGGIGQTVQEQLSSGVGTVMSKIASAGLLFVTGLTDVVLIVFAGIYFAKDPQSYARGLVKLFPAGARPRIAEVVANIGSALRLWLLGTLATMALISIFTTLGLWAIGAPAPLAIGLLAGAAEFVTFLGPIFSGFVAVLAASSEGTSMAVWVLAVMVAIQQMESNLITPMIQQRAVDLPPVLALFGIVAAGLVFGLVGVILAVPITVVGFVAVKQLYIRETLGEATSVPGEAARADG